MMMFVCLWSLHLCFLLPCFTQHLLMFLRKVSETAEMNEIRYNRQVTSLCSSRVLPCELQSLSNSTIYTTTTSIIDFEVAY